MIENLLILKRVEPKIEGCCPELVLKWILGSLCYFDSRRRYDKNNCNKEFLYLFRCLNISYRIKYSPSDKEYKVDKDLRIYLEDKICTSFLKIMETE